MGSTAGTIDEGKVTFTILNGGNPVGASVIANVSGNAASTTYTLLKGTAGGTYQVRGRLHRPDQFQDVDRFQSTERLRRGDDGHPIRRHGNF